MESFSRKIIAPYLGAFLTPSNNKSLIFAIANKNTKCQVIKVLLSLMTTLHFATILGGLT